MIFTAGLCRRDWGLFLSKYHVAWFYSNLGFTFIFKRFLQVTIQCVGSQTFRFGPDYADWWFKAWAGRWMKDPMLSILIVGRTFPSQTLTYICTHLFICCSAGPFFLEGILNHPAGFESGSLLDKNLGPDPGKWARGLGSAGLAQKIDFKNFKRFSLWRKPPT